MFSLQRNTIAVGPRRPFSPLSASLLLLKFATMSGSRRYPASQFRRDGKNFARVHHQMYCVICMLDRIAIA